MKELKIKYESVKRQIKNLKEMVRPFYTLICHFNI